MSKSLFKKFSSKARGAFGSAKPARRQRTRLGVESLESRQLFSTMVVGGNSTQPVSGSGLGVADHVILGVPIQHTAGTATTTGIDAGHIYQLTGTSIEIQSTSPNDAFGVVFFDGDQGGVLVEFAGQGLLTVSLDTTLPSFRLGNASGYTITDASGGTHTAVASQGLAAINIDGASAGSSIRVSEFNNAYDLAAAPAAGSIPTANGVANIRSISLTDTPTFNSILAADAVFSANAGSIGILAGGTNVTTAVRIGNIDASGSAVPSLAFGSGSTFANVEVYGGDLINDNGALFNSGANEGGLFTGTNIAGNTYGYGIEGLGTPAPTATSPQGGFTNENGFTVTFAANTNITNAQNEFTGFDSEVAGLTPTISLPSSLTTYTNPDGTVGITDSTTQADLDAFFTGKTFNSNFTIDINTTDGTTHGLIIGDGSTTAFDGSLSIVLGATSTAKTGSFDGGLEVNRLADVTFGTTASPVDLDSPITTAYTLTNGAAGRTYNGGRIGNVTINGSIDTDGGILGAGGITSVTVNGNVTGSGENYGSPGVEFTNAKFLTLGRANSQPASIGNITVTGEVNLANPTDALVNVAGGISGTNDGGETFGTALGTLGGLTIDGGGTLTGTHNIGHILITNDSSTVSGAISIADDTAIDFGGVQVINGPVRASSGIEGGALLGAIEVTTTGATSDLTLSGYIGANSAGAVGGTASAIGSVTLVAGRDLLLNAGIGNNIANFAGATATDGTAGSAPTSGLVLTAGRDITDNGGQNLFTELTSLPSVGITAGRDIDLAGSLGDSATSFGKLYFQAGRDIVSLPLTLQGGEVATQRGTTDTVITAGGDIEVASVTFGTLGNTSFNNITINTGATANGTTDFNEGLTPPTGDDIVDGALNIRGNTAGQITFNVDSTGTLGTLNLDSRSIDFTGAVTGVNANAAGTINLLNGGDIIAGSIGALQLGGVGNKAQINFTGGTTDTAFILVDDGTAAIDSIGALTIRGFLNGSAAADFEIQAGSIGDVNISTDLTPPTTGATEHAITEFGLLASNYRASAGNFNLYGGTGETLGTVATNGTATLSSASFAAYSIGAINITASGTGVTEGSSVFSGQNTFMAIGGIHGATGSATATNGVTINTGTSTTRLFDNTAGADRPSDAYFVAGNGNNNARGDTATYSIGGATLSDATIVTTGTPVVASIGDVNITAEGTQATNILGLSSETGLSPGLAILAGVHNPAPLAGNASGPIQGEGANAPLTPAQGPQDDLDSAPNNAFIQGTIGNVNLRSLTAAGPATGSLLPVSDQTPRPIEDFTSGGAYPLAAIAATTSIGTVQGVSGLTFPSILNGDSAVQVGVDTATPPRELTADSILVYLV